MRVGVLPKEPVGVEGGGGVFAIENCRIGKAAAPGSGGGGMILKVEVINTTVKAETFADYLEFVLNQSLLDFAVERMLLTSKLGLLKDDGMGMNAAAAVVPSR